MTLLATRALSRSFGGLRAVSNVDFELPSGEVHALIGPNGAGKSTFVGMISGRIPASSGQVFFEGEDVTQMLAHKRIRRGMAYTFQITSIYGKLSVAQNLALAARPHIDGPLKDAIAQTLARVGLEGREDERAGDLAYGHQRLLEIAMGLAQKPRLLILDEPTQGLADAEIEGFNSVINGLRGEATILLIEHNMAVVMALADAITVLNNGEVLASGAPEEIRANRSVQAAYLGTD